MHEGPTWLTPIRKAGVAGYASSGCPTLSDEDWRFTNLDPMRSCSFQHPSNSKGISKEAFQSIENPLKDPACIRVVWWMASLMKPCPIDRCSQRKSALGP